MLLLFIQPTLPLFQVLDRSYGKSQRTSRVAHFWFLKRECSARIVVLRCGLACICGICHSNSRVFTVQAREGRKRIAQRVSAGKEDGALCTICAVLSAQAFGNAFMLSFGSQSRQTHQKGPRRIRLSDGAGWAKGLAAPAGDCVGAPEFLKWRYAAILYSRRRRHVE
jgi:hypothetical protein